MHEGSRRAIIAAFLANLGIAIAKFVGFVLTGSASLLAEAIHSVADTGNQALLFLGGARAKRAATPEHPFGYGRERYFWAFVVAVVLFTLGGAFALYEGIEKLRHPHELENFGVAIAILLVSIGLEAWSFRTGAPRGEPREAKVRRLVALHPAHEEPRAARRPARGLGCAHRPLLRAHRGLAREDHREPALGRRWQHRDRPPPHRHLDRARRRDEGPAHR